MPPSSIAMATISEGTGITIGLVITLIGGVVWLTKMFMDIRSLRTDMSSLQNELNESGKSSSSREIKDTERLTRVETRLDSIEELLKDVKHDLRNLTKPT